MRCTGTIGTTKAGKPRRCAATASYNVVAGKYVRAPAVCQRCANKILATLRRNFPDAHLVAYTAKK